MTKRALMSKSKEVYFQMLDAPYDGRIMAKLAKPFININITEDQRTRLSSPVFA
jgi:hypothetical protein